jgi:hypothetical protein
MKKPITIFLFLLLSAVLCPAQKTLWSYGTARTLPMGQQEFGILHPFQIGATDKLEVSAQPLLGLTLAPNVSFKYRWYNEGWTLASRHAFTLPTLLVKSILYPPWNDTLHNGQEIPFIFNFRNEALATKQIGPEMLITARAGVEFSLKAWGDTTLPAITNKFLYLRSTTLNKRILLYAGAQYDVNIYKDFNAMVDVTLLSSGLLKDWGIEHKGYFIWNKSNKFAALIGYKSGVGSYPDPTLTLPQKTRFFIVPMADLIWKLNVQRKPQKDLFRVR